MPSFNVRALNLNCLRCKYMPIFTLEPCGHLVCYEHFLGKRLTKDGKDHCAHCGKHWEVANELQHPQPVIDTLEYRNDTWKADRPSDDDSEWPAAKMNGNYDNAYGRKSSGSQSNGNHVYADDREGFPTLRNGAGGFQQVNGFPPPSTARPQTDGFYAPPNGSIPPVNGNSYTNYAPPARHPQSNGFHPPGGYHPPQSNGYHAQGNGPARPDPSYGTRPPYGPPGRSYTINPTIHGSGMSSTYGYNPQAPRYIPAPMRDFNNGDHIVRPESSMSNQTFATQLPRRQPTMAAPIAQRPYTQGWGNGTNGLGAHLDSLSIKDHQPYGIPRTRNEDSVMGLNAQNGALTRSSDSPRSHLSRGDSPSSRLLAEEIMAGRAEDPWDRKMRTYTTPSKLPAPVLGPARYKDMKMFGKVERNMPAADIEALAMRPHQELPPPPRPDWLDLAIQGMMRPNLEEAFDSLPITELCRATNASTAGVIRVSDIPYTASKQELTAFAGRNAQLNRMPAGSPYHAVHVLMERESGKTLDCYIEVASPHEASWCVRQMNKRVEEGRPPKVGQRTVSVSVSSQDELMAELFPRAKHVRWVRGQPIVDQSSREYYQNSPADGFSGFVHTEEFHAMAKHANLSERAPFVSKSPCRVYEMMITMLYKYPWFAPDLVLVRERRAMYDCATSLITCLCEFVRNHQTDEHPNPLDPTQALLQELVSAALFCPGFSEKQKAYLNGLVKSQGFGAIADGKGVNIAIGGIHPYAIHWPFSALSLYPGVNYKLVEYYAALFREASSANQPGSGAPSLAARQKAKSTGYDVAPMGDFRFAYGNSPDTLSLAETAAAEYQKIEELLKVVCALPGQQPMSPTSQSYSNSNSRGSGGSSTGTRSS